MERERSRGGGHSRPMSGDRGGGDRDRDRGYGGGDRDRGGGNGDRDRDRGDSGGYRGGGGGRVRRDGNGFGRGGHTSRSGSDGSDGSTGKRKSDDETEEGRRGRARTGPRGGGRGRGRKTFQEMKQERLDMLDMVVSPRKDKATGQPQSKQGTSGQKVNLLANYFALVKRTDWVLFHYRVDFAPDEEDTRLKKKLVRDHEKTLGAYIFDGSSLYMSHRINPDPMSLYSNTETGERYQISIRMVAQLASTDVMYLQIFNILLRKCSEFMDLEELGRHYYDRHQAIAIPAHHLELWPGYKTSMRNHENGILLGVEITHKVLRKDNCLHVINQLKQNQRGYGDIRQKIRNELVGSIVMTHYNRKTYRVDDIDWEQNPNSTFDMKGTAVSFSEYYRKYNQHCSDMNQPLLVSRPKKKDFHRGQTGPVLLIPEFCQMTGLTDEMRSNFQLMKSLSTHLHKTPAERVVAVQNFMKRLRDCTEAKSELIKWGLQFGNDLVRVQGRVLPSETLKFGNNQPVVASERADWDNAYKSNKQMTTCIPLNNWIIVVTQRDSSAIDQVVRMMKDVGRPIGFTIQEPRAVIRVQDPRAGTFISAIEQAMANQELQGGKLQLVFVILPTTAVELYAAIKRRCAVDYGIPSQCFVSKNAQKPVPALRSIVTKVVVQINAKLGGQPWAIGVPLGQLMIVGFDVYHCGKRKGASVGAMVATYYDVANTQNPRYYSSVNYHQSKDELSNNLCADLTKCIHFFYSISKTLPKRIIMYRDGVGEGQLAFLYGTEIPQIKQSINSVYIKAGEQAPRFTFIVCTKRINTRIFADSRGVTNPNPGTIVDDVITLPERFDFYMVSQFSRQGTVSPTSYNVLEDEQGLSPDQLQKLTFKLCHSYFNWSGTVAVPAPCQFAHKLAYLTGIALQGSSSSEKLSHLLHYL